MATWNSCFFLTIHPWLLKKQRKTRKLTMRNKEIICHYLTLSWRRRLSYWFLYDNGLRHERVKSEKHASFLCSFLGATLCINRLQFKQVLENFHKIQGFYSAYMVCCAIRYNLHNLKKHQVFLHGCFSHFLNRTNGTKSRNDVFWTLLNI